MQRLDATIQQRVLEALERLQDDPYVGEKVQAQQTGNWRLRVGDWRIRYDIVGREVHIFRVRHHREVYREE